MSRRAGGAALRHASGALVIAAGLSGLGCAEAEGPVGSPGGRDGIRLEYVTPRLQVISTDRPQTVTLALRVLRPGSSGEPVPYPGARLEARLEAGRGRIDRAVAVTGEEGFAAFLVGMPAGGDRTSVAVRLAADERSWLPFDVVSAEIVPVEMEPGEIREIDAPRSGALLRFPASPSAAYILIPHQTDLERSGAAYRFLHQTSPPRPEAVAWGAAGPTMPRARLAAHGDPGPAAGSLDGGRLEASAGVPQWVNIRSCGIDVDRKAPLRYLGERIGIYVDGPLGSHQARIDSLGIAFDRDIFPTNTRLFGPTTDLDGNGRVLAILSPELETNSGIYCDAVRMLGVEAFYGQWKPLDPIDHALGILAHEHQHVINAGHHRRTRGTAGDDRWLNEGLSYVAEAHNGYWRASLMRLWQFLANPNGGLSLLPLEYRAPFTDENMMLLLYVGDRFGPETYLDLGRSGKAGVRNIEAVTGLPFEEILSDWFVTIAVSNRDVTEDPRYNYTSIDLHGMAAEIAACRCVAPARFDGMRLEDLSLESAFDIWRTLDRADADYFRLGADAAGPAHPHDVYYDAFGLQAVRLTVVRLR